MVKVADQIWFNQTGPTRCSCIVLELQNRTLQRRNAKAQRANGIAMRFNTAKGNNRG